MTPTSSLWPDPESLGAITDLYQLTMMAGYHAAGIEGSRAVFELFVRRLPQGRSYLVFAGLEQAVEDLTRMRLGPEQVEALRRWPTFAHVDPGWFDALPDLRFRGDVWSVPEGTVVFAGEPIVRVETTIAEAQWIETFLIASVAYPTLVASKAARIVEAARGHSLFDFGTRRGHGPMAGMIAARASYLAGFAGTSNVEAALRLGIPCSGTMAHSWVQAFADEPTAFAAFARTFPGATLLVDTYDVARGVEHAARVEPPVAAIRIDSGDLDVESRKARGILDSLGRGAVTIVASGDLDEWSIDRLVSAGAPIDAFGVGTELVTSRDAPALSMVYKLVAIDGHGRDEAQPRQEDVSSGRSRSIRSPRRGEGRFAGDYGSRGADETGGWRGDVARPGRDRGGEKLAAGSSPRSARSASTVAVPMLAGAARRVARNWTRTVTLSGDV